MKKIILSLLFILSFSVNSYSQSTGAQNNAVLEYCTGTWCQYCPCGHSIIEGILSNYPETVVLAYHGAGNDPWIAPSLPMIQAFGFSSYPTGVIGRKSGIIQRPGWNNQVILSSFNTPNVTINVASKNYNSGNRTFTATVNLTARANISGNYSVNYIITEDNIIYSQTGNSGCTGSSAYTHNHVVKGLINGQTGESVISGNWAVDQTVGKQINYVVPAGIVPENSFINIFVYKTGTSSIATDYDIQQAIRIPLTTVTGIGNNNTIADQYSLAQNYPNPFNPVTNITYSIPKDGEVTFRVYDMIGNEVGTYVNGFQKSGIYTVTFDGANLASGVYYYKLEANNFSETKKMMLIK